MLNFIQEWDTEKNLLHFPNHSASSLNHGSNLKFWWICVDGHSFDCSPRNRSNGTNCTVCSNRKLLTGFNDFESKFPEVAEKWKEVKSNPSPVETLYSSTKINIVFPCEKGHYYETTPASLARGRRCPYCSGAKVLAGFNDLLSQSDSCNEWWDFNKNTLNPEIIAAHSSVKYYFLCPKNHSFAARADKFTQGQRCPYCAGKKVDDHNTIAALEPSLVEEWDWKKNNKKPSEITPGSSEKVWWICRDCGHNWESLVYNRNSNKKQGCPKCAKGKTSSKGEKEVASYVKSIYKGTVLQNYRLKSPGKKTVELDIYIPEKSLAIEFNGVYYHSEKFVDKDYHEQKYLRAKESGIQLIQIWEDEWSKKRTIVENVISHKLNLSTNKVHARKTTARLLNKSEAQIFFEDNHIQGSAPASFFYGLILEEEIVAAIAIRKEKQGKIYNIVRYATSFTVAGGFTKLLSYVENVSESVEEFITFSDNAISNGGLYENNGFTKTSTLHPDYRYIVGNIRKHKFGYRLQKFKSDPNLLYEEGKSEKELAALNGLRRIYDAGKVKWTRPVAKKE